jgi:hypothetical protein
LLRASGDQEDGIAARFAWRFEATLQGLHEGLVRPRTTKRPPSRGNASGG